MSRIRKKIEIYFDALFFWCSLKTKIRFFWPKRPFCSNLYARVLFLWAPVGIQNDSRIQYMIFLVEISTPCASTSRYELVRAAKVSPGRFYKKRLRDATILWLLWNGCSSQLHKAKRSKKFLQDLWHVENQGKESKFVLMLSFFLMLT